MTSYFPLPPNLKLINKNEKIYGSLTFLNYPSNFRIKNKKKIFKKDVFIGIYIIRDNLWNLLEVKKCELKEFIEIKRKDLDINDTEMAVLLLSKDNNFPSKCEVLPEPFSLRIDNANVQERVSYNFTYRSCSTSYQGEYPYRMASIPSGKGSFFSYDALKSNYESKEKYNFFLIMNLSIYSARRKIINIKVFDPESKKLHKFIETRENLISIHDLRGFPNKNLFYSSNEAVFVPLMLSLDSMNEKMSLEHVHPPGEMFSGLNKIEAIKILKKKWIW